MAQLRDYKDDFEDLNVEVLVFGPENKEKFKRYWDQEKMPFIGFPDSEKLMKEYGQESKWYKLGRMPFQIVGDKKGQVIEKHWGNSMKDIPDVSKVLNLFRKEENY